MDKLIKLLNEYEREKQGLPKDFEDYTMWNIEGNEIMQPSCDPDSREYFKYYIISKDYEFIKWLIENDKVEITNIWRLPKRLYINSDGITCVDDMCEDCYYNAYESLLMLLAIKEDSIKFLVDILK